MNDTKFFRYNSVVIFIIFVVGLLIRFRYTSELPVTNDEGAYLYDAYNINNGLFPLRDYLTKSLPLIYSLFGVIKMLGNSLIVGRLFSIFMSFIASFYIFKLGKELFEKRVALIAAGFYWSFPSIAAYTTLIHTEVMQTALVIVSAYYILEGVKSNKLSSLLLSGMGLGIAFFVRQSSIAFFGFALFYLIFELKRTTKLAPSLLALVSGFLSIIIPVYLLADKYIGKEKIAELFGGGAVQLALGQQSQFSLRALPVFILDRMFELFAESSLLLHDGLLITTLTVLFIFFAICSKAKLSAKKLAIRLFVFLSIVSLGVFTLQARLSFFTVLWKMKLLLMLVTFGVLGLLFFLSLLFYIDEIYIKVDKKYLKGSVFLAGWTIFLSIIYLYWIKFRTPYIIEFFPILVLIASASLHQILGVLKDIKDENLERLLKIGIYSVSFAALILSYFWNLRFPATGLHTPQQINEVVEFLKKNTKPQEEILTASVIFPFLSGNRVPYNISHPAWYGYPDITKDTLLLFFPSFNDFSDYIKDKKIRFVIMDPFTQSSYFKLHPDFYEYVESEYEPVKVVGRVKVLKLK